MKNFLLKCGAVFLLIGGLFLFMNRYSYISMFNDPVDIQDEGVADADEIKGGMAVDGEIYLIVDCFGQEEVTQKSRYGSTTSKNTYNYYIVPVFVGEEDTYYVALKVNTKDSERYTCDGIVDETLAWLMGESSSVGEKYLDFTGCLSKLDKEKYGYMKDWFKETGFITSSSDIDKYVLPYVLEPYKRNNVKVMMIVFVSVFFGGLVMVIMGVLWDRKYAARRKALKNLQGKVITVNGVNLNVSGMEDVDILIWKGKYDKAKKLLTKGYRANPMEAQMIIEGWNQMVGL